MICAQASLEQVILGNASPVPAAVAPVCAAAAPAAPAPAAACCEAKAVRIEKRVLTEKDLIEANMSGVTEVHIGEKTIVTALAKDAAKDRGMTIVRDED